jgi:hypothetical protein
LVIAGATENALLRSKYISALIADAMKMSSRLGSNLFNGILLGC